MLEVQLTNSEQYYLESCLDTLPDDGIITEWGSGGTTLMMAQRLKPNQKLYSIEHNVAWYNHVDTSLRFLGVRDKVELILARSLFAEIEFAGQEFISTAHEESPVSLDDYVYPGPEVFDADLFLVDGLARCVCLLMIRMYRTKPGAIILAHDVGYSYRYDWYSWIYKHFSSYQKIDEREDTTMVRFHI